MKKFIYPMWAFMACALTASPQNVFIPDANFKAILIEEGVDTDNNGEISVAEAQAETDLHISAFLTPVADITGLEAFVNLERLAIGSYYGTVPVNPANHPHLKIFDYSYSNTTHVDMSPCPQLLTCAISDCPLVSLDITQNQYLQNLYVMFTDLAQIDLSQNEELVVLNFQDNKLTQLDVKHKIFLNSLVIHNNLLTELDLTGTPYLEWLKCDGNQLASLDIRPEENLDYMDCRANPALETVCVNDVGEAQQAELEGRYQKDGSMAWSETCANAAGIGEAALASVTVFPNPAVDFVVLEGNYASVRLFDMQGKELALRGMGKLYDVSMLKSGVYHLLLTSPDGSVYTARLLKK